MQIKGIEISFITIYRVCKIHVNLKMNTAYAQEWKELTGRSCRKIGPREYTLHDLKKIRGERNREYKGGGYYDGEFGKQDG